MWKILSESNQKSNATSTHLIKTRPQYVRKNFFPCFSKGKVSMRKKDNDRHKKNTDPLCDNTMSPSRESVKEATSVKIFTLWILSTVVNLQEDIEPSKFAIKEKLNNCL